MFTLFLAYSTERHEKSQKEVKALKVKIREKNEKLTVPKCSCCSDTFVCDTCGTRVILRRRGDSIPCTQSGCNGTMRRQ